MAIDNFERYGIFMSKKGKILRTKYDSVNTYDDGYINIDSGEYEILEHYYDIDSATGTNYYEIKYNNRHIFVKADDYVEVIE